MEGEMRLVRILLRKFDMSDIESAEAKKEAEIFLEESRPNKQTQENL